MNWKNLVAGAVVVVFSAGVSAQTVTKNVVYTKDAAGVQRGDLYQPVGAGPFPAVVFLHGGAWRSGSKSGFKKMGMDLAAKGYVGFSVNYNLKAGSFPRSWEEARAAVRFVREHAAEYHVDPNRVVIAGTSAGGQLAALVALAPQGPKGRKNGDVVTVQGAVILNGVFDLCYPVGVIARYMGGQCAEKKDAYLDASPIHHVHAGAPSFFVGHGTKDRVVPYAAAEKFTDELKKNGVPLTSFVAEGGPHMYWMKGKYYARNLAAVEAFLGSVVGK
ncbi:MAG: alpha/beta hydrolase [Bryocella sp.]